MNQLMRQRPVNNPDMPYMNYQPLSVPKRFRQTQPNGRYQTPPHSFEADHPSSEAVEHSKPYLQGPEDGQDVHEVSGFRNDKCPSDCNHLDNECPNDLDEHVDDLSEQEQASETVSDNCDPEVLPEVAPQSNDPWVPEPAFSMDNYSARDVDCWARTLLADQFEQLQILGPASRIESFRQYAITNLDQPTQTLTQKTSSTPQLNQEPHCHIPSEVADNQNQYVDSTSNDSNNPFLHSHHVNQQPDQSTHSSYYDHSNYSTTDLDENPYNTVVYDDGYDGGFDNGGFDDGGFDDSGFDNGGFDDGGFDDGGFDNGYGSPYY
ncbi:hypothetical protein PGT21_031110 [Puccinia graminis f. sp. tritici]|uniref:Uncharacterized protein n=1 Tax=Puccinia graminis f. sp. tritici TaxID=56615 RepID=A0A5B0QU28_PUCGR|nr:hypothetical protein PGT21_031110 [Puccinia graminis f. sp. tritici]KAA1116807.1 hypothetical protein PGTUg99_021343 [Puccinia graminis f. sp. tritici]